MEDFLIWTKFVHILCWLSSPYEYWSTLNSSVFWKESYLGWQYQGGLLPFGLGI